MSPSSKITSLLLITVIALITLAAEAKISESELKSYGSAFLAKAQNDNPEAENKIHKCLNGVLKERAAGIRLIDKIGLFLYDCRKKGILVNKVRFFSHQKIFALYIVMEKQKEGQIFNLYLEYAYEKGEVILQDIYFFVGFEEEMKQIRNYF